jgi:hypothetical protein
MLDDKTRAAFDAIARELDGETLARHAVASWRRPRRTYRILLASGLLGSVALFLWSMWATMAMLVVAGIGLYGTLETRAGQVRGEQDDALEEEEEPRGLLGWLTSRGIVRRVEWESAAQQGVRNHAMAAFGGAATPGSPQWNKAFYLLSGYVAREGNALVPQDHVEEGFPLGRWVVLVRVARRIRELTPEQVQQFDALGMDWNSLR